MQNLSCNPLYLCLGTFIVLKFHSKSSSKTLLLSSSDVIILISNPCFFFKINSSKISLSANHATATQIVYLAVRIL